MVDHVSPRGRGVGCDGVSWRTSSVSVHLNRMLLPPFFLTLGTVFSSLSNPYFGDCSPALSQLSRSSR